MKRLLCLLLALCMVLSLTACGGEQPESIQLFAMDTVMDLTAYGENAAAALTDASREINRLERLLSRTIDTSEISQINAGGAVTVSEETASLLAQAQTYTAATDGAFDVTIAPLVSLWGITTDSPYVPTQQEIDALLPLVGSEHLHLSGDTATLDDGCAIDLGGLFAGNASAMLFSLLGGLTAMLVMILLRRLRCLSIYGVSIGGAAGHNLGQMAAALITLGNTAVLGYLPFLLGISLLTGTLTGFVSSLLFRAMAHIKLSAKE